MNYIDTTIQLAEHLVGQVNGLCGKFEQPPINKFIGSDGKEYPDGTAFGNTWKVPDNDNIFTCTDHCAGAPSATPPPQNNACRIPDIQDAKVEGNCIDHGPAEYKVFTAPPYDVAKETVKITEIIKIVVTPNKEPTPEWLATAKEFCTKILTIPDAKALVDPAPYIDDCTRDCKLSGAYSFVDGWKVKYLDRVRIVTKSVKQEPHVLYKANDGAVQITVKIDQAYKSLGIGDTNCPNNCSGHGDCQATGCLCKEGFTGHICDIEIPNAPSAEEAFTDEDAPLCRMVEVLPAHPIMKFLTGNKRGNVRKPKFCRHTLQRRPHSAYAEHHHHQHKENKRRRK